MNGILIVNKSSGYTSQDVIYDARRILGTRKIGHGGTLDPMVTGVLPLFIGHGTKVSSFALEADKVYEGILVFGKETSTQDIEGEVLAETDFIPNGEEIRKAANKDWMLFQGGGRFRVLTVCHQKS